MSDDGSEESNSEVGQESSGTDSDEEDESDLALSEGEAAAAGRGGDARVEDIFMIPPGFRGAKLPDTREYAASLASDDYELWVLKLPSSMSLKQLNGVTFRVGNPDGTPVTPRLSLYEDNTAPHRSLVNVFPTPGGDLVPGRPFQRALQVIEVGRDRSDQLHENLCKAQCAHVTPPNIQPSGLGVRFCPPGCNESVFSRKKPKIEIRGGQSSRALARQREAFLGERPFVEVKTENRAREKEERRRKRKARRAALKEREAKQVAAGPDDNAREPTTAGEGNDSASKREKKKRKRKDESSSKSKRRKKE